MVKSFAPREANGYIKKGAINGLGNKGCLSSRCEGPKPVGVDSPLVV